MYATSERLLNVFNGDGVLLVAELPPVMNTPACGHDLMTGPRAPYGGSGNAPAPEPRF